MKNIELTDKHKSKLLEMCKVLFKDKNIRYNKNGHDYGTFLVSDKEPFIIHWFEFCMTYLVEKVLNPGKPQRNQREMFCNFFWETNIYWYYTQNGSLPVTSFEAGAKHPIDYLYEEFKKLKK